MPFHITGIVLAAGLGTRFDPSGRRYKLVQLLPDRRPVIVASCAAIAPHVDELIVVVGERGHELDHVLNDLPDKIIRVHCPDAAVGLGASLKAGVRASGPCDAWLVGLADMPWVKHSTVDSVCETLRQGTQLVRPFYQGHPGHPVGIESSLRGELMALPDESGAASLMQRHAKVMAGLDLNDPGCIQDVDLPTDLLR